MSVECSRPLGTSVKQVDTLLKSDEAALVFEAIGDGKVRVTCQSWDIPRLF